MKRFLLGLALLLAVAAGVLYFVPATLLASVRTVERGLAGLSEHSVQVDNLEIAYLEGGSEKNPTLLLIHGFGADKDNWLRFARPLTERYHVVALDLPGFGDSSKPQQASYDVGTQAERVANFAAAIGVRRLHLAGNSMGGHIAALYAARHPEQVLSLALIDNAGVMPARKSELFEDLERGENPGGAPAGRLPEAARLRVRPATAAAGAAQALPRRTRGSPRRRSTRRYSNNCASATSRWSRNCRRSRHRPCCCGATATACWTSPASR